VLGLSGEAYLVVHLMIAGRLHWQAGARRQRTAKPLARFRFTSGTLILTEAGSKRRASLHIVGSEEKLGLFDRGGLDPTSVVLEAFADRLRSENHTLKRALTDPRMVDGVGNAYSDEVLFRARLSPFDQTRSLSDEGYARLHAACREILLEWTERIRTERAGEFPREVTAFRDGMAVHGRYGKPCPDCGTEVQRIRYAENECNYCPRCQVGGKVYADRALSRLLKGDWPSRIEELEGQHGGGKAAE
jgi:formamidopyrimidine-DNA glycosylase